MPADTFHLPVRDESAVIMHLPIGRECGIAAKLVKAEVSLIKITNVLIHPNFLSLVQDLQHHKNKVESGAV